MIIAAADGSALGNPGPAGWAWYVSDDCWAAGGWPHGTNNMGELMAVLDLLRQTATAAEPLTVLCDSTYAINTITKWSAGWKRRGWKKADGKAVLNLDLIQALDEAMRGRDVTFEWVKGHAGHPLNEAADARANAAARAYQQGTSVQEGPGFLGARPAGIAGSSPEAPPPDVASGDISHATSGGGAHASHQLDLFSDLEDAAPTGPEASSGERRDIEAVLDLERALLRDETRADPQAMARLLHPQWREIGSSGRLWSREEILSVGPLPRHTGLELVEGSMIGPDTILLLWRSHNDTGDGLRSSLWVREGESWRQRFHQGTALG